MLTRSIDCTLYANFFVHSHAVHNPRFLPRKICDSCAGLSRCCLDLLHWYKARNRSDLTWSKIEKPDLRFHLIWTWINLTLNLNAIFWFDPNLKFLTWVRSGSGSFDIKLLQNFQVTWTWNIQVRFKSENGIQVHVMFGSNLKLWQPFQKVYFVEKICKDPNWQSWVLKMVLAFRVQIRVTITSNNFGCRSDLNCETKV